MGIMSQPLTKIKGIGPSAAEKLKEVGITNVEQLAKSSEKNLVKIKGIGKKSATTWITLAQDLLSGSSQKKASHNSKTEKDPKTKQTTVKKEKSSTPTKTKKTPAKKIAKSKKKKESSISKSKEKKQLIFTDTAEPIPSFLRKRLSKKANKILDMSLGSLKREDLKTLKKYQRTLDPERIKFSPSIEKEKNAILAIDEKSKMLEQLILHYKENQADNIFEDYFVEPLKDGDFNDQIEKIGKFFNAEKAAIQIFDDLKKRARKKYPFSEINFIKRIKKYIIKNYPDKVEQNE